MTELVKVPLDNATRDQLLYYAQNVLNIEVSFGTNDAAIRAKIMRAQPTDNQIKVPASMVASKDDDGPQAPPPAKKEKAKAEPIPTGAATTHSRFDPKVEISIMPTTEPTRAKDVQIACQGDTIIVKRGQRVKIPYRHFLVLRDAIEQVARDTDEISQITGLPIKEWVEQHSYPFQIYDMPSPEEIEAWEKRLGAVELA